MDTIKKIITLIAVLVVLSPSVFAGFSGKVESGFYYDLDNFKWGLSSSNTVANINLDLLGETRFGGGLGDIKAEVKAYLSLWLEKSGTPTESDGSFSFANVNGRVRLDYAKVFGPGWEFSLLSVPGVPSYARSSIDEVKNVFGGYDNADLARNIGSYPGVFFKYNENTIGLGFNGVGLDEVNTRLYLESQRILFDNGFMFRFAGYGDYAAASNPRFGLSGKFGYWGDKLNLYLASDVDFSDITSSSMTLKADLLLRAWYDFIGFDMYYATLANVPKEGDREDYMSLKCTSNLDSFDVPLTLSFVVKDVLAKQDMMISAGYCFLEHYTTSLHVGYTVANNGRDGKSIRFFSSPEERKSKWTLGSSFIYDNPALMKAEVGFNVSQIISSEAVWSLYLELSSKAIIPGADLAIRYVADDLTKASSAATSNGDLGTLSVTCSIEF